MTIKKRLHKEIGKKEELKKENEQLRNYIQHLTNPIAQGDAVIPPPLSLPQETVEDFEEMKVTTKEAKEWMADINNEVVTFVEELILAHGQTSSLLSRVQDKAEMWDDLQNIQDKIIPCLKVLKRPNRN